MNILVNITKIALIAIYASLPVSFLLPVLSDYRQILSIVVVVLLIAHATEYLAMKGKMHKAAPERSDHFWQTLLFGYGHWLPITKGPR